MAKKKDKKTKFRLTYFTPAGTYYTHEVVEWASQLDEYGTVMMTPVFSRVRALLLGTADEDLPGLSRRDWDGPVLVELEDRGVVGYPSLINPRPECGGK